MTESNALLKKLETAVSEHRDEVMADALDAALDAGAPSADVRHAIMQGLENVRHRLMSNDFSIPDFLICIDTATGGLDRLSSLRKDDRAGEEDISLVIGVVEGDPHDMGKNIIAAVYRTRGYHVFDLGREVSKDTFVRSVQETGAKVLALSAMMSTTMTGMRDIIQEVRVKSPDTVVIVGGAPMDEKLAASYGADGYAESAVNVLEETEAAVKKCSSEVLRNL